MIGSETYTPTTQVADVASNRAVVVLDTGTSWSYVYVATSVIICLSSFFSYAPMDVCEIIYSGVSGAQYSSALGQWVLPCDAEINMALQFG